MEKFHVNFVLKRTLHTIQHNHEKIIEKNETCWSLNINTYCILVKILKKYMERKNPPNALYLLHYIKLDPWKQTNKGIPNRS